jgi:glyoxylase-like metal-dependent hydrolase (beta-lactamase superfamily II)
MFCDLAGSTGLSRQFCPHTGLLAIFPLSIEGAEIMKIQHFFDPRTCTLTYVVADDATRKAVVVDSVLDYDPKNGRIWEESIENVDRYLTENQLELLYILDTHAHADHLSGAQVFKARHGAKFGIGANISRVQETFKHVFDMGEDFATDGSQFDLLLQDGDLLSLGQLKIKAIYTPGHTPACMSYLVDDALFTGDALFMPDSGTGRCDFPNGSPADLYESVHEKLYALHDGTRVFVGHDYQPGDREVRWETTIGESKTNNIGLREETSKQEFIKFRQERDDTLAVPVLIFPSVQVNICAARLPQPHSNGIAYLKIPLNVL